MTEHASDLKLLKPIFVASLFCGQKFFSLFLISHISVDVSKKSILIIMYG